MGCRKIPSLYEIQNFCEDLMPSQGIEILKARKKVTV